MPGNPSLTTFANLGPPWSLSSLDTNFTAIGTLLRSVNNYTAFSADSGGANAYAATFNAPLTFSLANGVAIMFKAGNTNTGASTLAVNGGAATPIVNPNGTALLPGQIVAGAVVSVLYDGSNWILVGASTAIGPDNVLINGAFNWLQDASINNHNPTANAVSYMLQRWYNFQNGGSTSDMSVSQLANGPATDGALTNKNKGSYPFECRVTRNVAATLTDSRFKQVLPTSISRRLSGLPVTITFYARCGAGYSPAADALPVVLVTGTGTDQSASSVEAGTWTGQATAFSQSVTLTTSWQEFTLNTSALNTNVTQIAFGFQPTWDAGAAPANDYFEIAGVRIAPRYANDAAIQEVAPDVDLARCRWFFETLNDLAATNVDIGAGFLVSTTQAFIDLRYVPKRTTPAISVSAAADFVLQNAAANDACTVLTAAANTIGIDRARLVATIGVGRTAGDGALLAAGAGTARVFINAEF